MGYFLSGVLVLSLIMLLCAYFCRESVRNLFKAPFRLWEYGLISLISFIAILDILGFTYLFGAYSNSLGAFPFGASADKIEGADYLSAAATIIGACISLVPIFWLIRQSNQSQKQLDSQNEQLKLQRAQNNSGMLVDACNLVKSAIIDDNDKSRTILRATIPLLRDEACQDNGKYAWVAVKTLGDIPMVIRKDADSKLTANVIEALKIIGKDLVSIKCKDKHEVASALISSLYAISRKGPKLSKKKVRKTICYLSKYDLLFKLIISYKKKEYFTNGCIERTS